MSIFMNGEEYGPVVLEKDNTTLYALLNGSLTEFENSDVTSLRGRAFANANSLITVFLPNVTSFGEFVFFRCYNLKNVYLPALSSFTTNGQFQECTSLEKIMFGQQLPRISSSMFNGCSALMNVVLTKTSVTQLQSINAFSETPFRNGTGGTVYVPYWITVSGQTVNGVTAYSTATNWSTLKTESTTFKSIQENLVELQTLDVYGFKLSDYYLIVDELPQTDIATDKIYFILKTGETNKYEQWFHSSSSWEQLEDITLGGNS